MYFHSQAQRSPGCEHLDWLCASCAPSQEPLQHATLLSTEHSSALACDQVQPVDCAVLQGCLENPMLRGHLWGASISMCRSNLVAAAFLSSLPDR